MAPSYLISEFKRFAHLEKLNLNFPGSSFAILDHLKVIFYVANILTDLLYMPIRLTAIRAQGLLRPPLAKSIKYQIIYMFLSI